VFIATNQPSVTIIVPESRQLRVLGIPERSRRLNCRVTSGTTEAEFQLHMVNGLDGPVEVSLSGPEMTFFTYMLQDSSIATLPSGPIATSGISALSVEKSTDMTNWFPAAIMLNDGSPQSFYRLKAGQLKTPSAFASGLSGNSGRSLPGSGRAIQPFTAQIVELNCARIIGEGWHCGGFCLAFVEICDKASLQWERAGHSGLMVALRLARTLLCGGHASIPPRLDASQQLTTERT